MAGSIEIISPHPYVHRAGESPKAQIILNNRCQLRCAWCWGPEHAAPENGKLEDWERLLTHLKTAERKPFIGPVDKITISGGEPLLSPFLLPVLKAARTRQIRTKISTNGIFLNRLAEVLPFADELAVGIDGCDEESHARMRQGARAHGAHAKAMGAVVLGQEHDKPVTVRTVVSKKNLGAITAIPIAMEQAGVDLSRIRHKLYQLEPIGPRKNDFSMDEWATSSEDVLDIAGMVKAHYPEMQVGVQLYRLTDARYLNFESSGRAYGIDVRPTERRPKEVEYGNAFTNFDEVYRNYGNHWWDNTMAAGAFERGF